MAETQTTIFGSIPALCLVLAGCSTFDRDWEAACQSYDHESIEGPWQGVWKSGATGQTAEVRCLVTEREEGGYVARKRIDFGFMFSGEETIPIRADHRHDMITVRGEVDRGFNGGVLRYEGSVKNGKYTAQYHSRYDYGKYIMTRPSRPADETGG